MNSIINNTWATIFIKPQTNNIMNGIVKITSRSLRVVLLLKKDRVATVPHNSNMHGLQFFLLLPGFFSAWNWCSQARNRIFTEIVVHFPIKSIRRWVTESSSLRVLGYPYRGGVDASEHQRCRWKFQPCMAWGRPFSKMATVVPFRSFLAYNNRPYRSFNSIACVAKAFGYTMERVLVLYAVLQCCPSLAHNNTLFYICMPEL